MLRRLPALIVLVLLAHGAPDAAADEPTVTATSTAVLRPLPLAEGVRDVLNPGGDAEKLKTREVYRLAERRGIDLAEEQPDPIVAHALTGGRLFYVFYKTFEKAYGKRRYVIQRIKRTKRYWEDETSEPTQAVTYQVEIFKLFGGALKRGDQHHGDYGRQENARREIVKEYEIGFGEIPGQVEGEAWPFAANRLFEYVYRYGPDSTVYDAVRFEDSVKWRLDVQLSQDGSYSIRAPALGIDVPAKVTDAARTVSKPAPASADVVLVRGQGVEGLEPDADWMTSYKQALGAVVQDHATPNGHRNIVFQAGLLANRKPDGALNTIQTRPGFAGRTKEGVAIGTPRAEVEETYGKPERGAPDAVWWHYGDLGFWFDGVGRVGRIYVRIRE